MLYLQSLGVAITPTIPYVGPLDESSILAYSSFRFPGIASKNLVIKPIHGELGLAVVTVSEIDTLKQEMKHLGDVYEWLIQPLDSAIFRYGERSLHYFGGEFLYSAVKYVKRGEMRANANRRSSVSTYDPSSQEMQLAEEAMSLLPIETEGIFRIDLLGTPQEPRISEIEFVNPALILSCFDSKKNPEESKAFVFRKLYEYIERTLSQQK